MQIDGYALREALKQWELRKDAAEKAFTSSLHKFADEKKDAPQQVVDAYLKAEDAISKLQVAQMRYNLAVKVEVQGEKMTLAEAIKRVGGAGRVEKMWKGATPQERHHRYGDDGLTRTAGQERAEATIDAKTVVSLATQASKRSGAYRAAIAKTNGVSLDIEDLSPALFE